MVHDIPISEKNFIGGDLNGHVGKINNGYERNHGGFGFGNRNEEGSSILDFSIAWDLLLANTYFKKREEHLITYKSGSSISQIDFLLTRKSDQKLCKDCKVIPGEHVTTQHRLLVLDIRINTYK
ncbi:exonuclease/endonuclease/phosphatase family protein [Vibrio parahaemolyticus]|uniref:hypothetical protein n=1 Tax=Vibrio parahaemolyticus TaxID=670 RepID=UPI00226AECF8|nr:hypothetical protein [Vibrio parahaemolyticus]MCX8789090.1 hypothetical protein [Vibrio parahaemolyticus]